MKKSLSIILCLAMLLSVSACGKKNKTADESSPAATEAPVQAGLASPVTELTGEEFFTALGYTMSLPVDITNISFCSVDSGADAPIYQIKFTYSGMDFTYRSQVSPVNGSDISGIHETWAETQKLVLTDGTEATVQLCDACALLLWQKDDTCFSLSSSAKQVGQQQAYDLLLGLYCDMFPAEQTISDIQNEVLFRFVIDGERTNANLKNVSDIYMLYGSALRDYGSDLTLYADGAVTVSIGVVYAEGIWEKTDTGLWLTVNELSEGTPVPREFALTAEVDGDEVFFLMDSSMGDSNAPLNETVYWREAD